MVEVFKWDYDWVPLENKTYKAQYDRAPRAR